MCAGCSSSTQGAYNNESNTKAGQFTDNNGAQSGTGSVDESGLGAPGTSAKFDGQRAGSESNPHIGNRGWGN